MGNSAPKVFRFGFGGGGGGEARHYGGRGNLVKFLRPPSAAKIVKIKLDIAVLGTTFKNFLRLFLFFRHYYIAELNKTCNLHVIMLQRMHI